MLDVRPLGGPLYTAENRTAAVHAEAHGFYRTTCADGCAAADRRTAALLITPRNFLTAAKRDPRIVSIAEALWVTQAVVDTYIRALPMEDWLRMRNLVGHDPY
jgi:hypothetical protein